MRYILHRTHRFAIGDTVFHVDSPDPEFHMRVEELTIRITNGVAFPTYTLLGRTHGIVEQVDDVLDTMDLAKAEFKYEPRASQR